jgi:hypothetical protein
MEKAGSRNPAPHSTATALKSLQRVFYNKRTLLAFDSLSSFSEHNSEGLKPMSTYYITFRLANKTIGGKTYDERRSQMIENVHAEGTGFWEDTTSFFIVESSFDTDRFAAKACEGLSRSEDMLLAFDTSDMSASYFGAIKHLDVLRSFFPKLKKVP